MQKKLGLAAAGVCGIIIVAAISYFAMGSDNFSFSKPKAAIIDMLYSKLPNVDFEKTAIKDLQDAGYQVDVYKTSNSTVELYKKLPSMNYKYIVFRTHGLHHGDIEPSASIFSGEVYTLNKYFNEQMSGEVGKAVTLTHAEIIARGGWAGLNNQTYFTIGSKFVDNSMVGKFPDSVILIAGCDALSNDDLAKSLVAKGASDVIGWNNLVAADDNDKMILKVLTEITENKQTPENATKIVMANFTSKSSFGGKLVHYSE